MIRHRLLIGALLVGTLYAPAALAQPRSPETPPGALPAAQPAAKPSAPVTRKDADSFYAFEFFDENPLVTSNDAFICRWPAPPPTRSPLVKLRLSFVPELLKSVKVL